MNGGSPLANLNQDLESQLSSFSNRRSSFGVERAQSLMTSETTQSLKPISPEIKKNKSPMFKLPDKDKYIIQGTS